MNKALSSKAAKLKTIKRETAAKQKGFSLLFLKVFRDGDEVT